MVNNLEINNPIFNHIQKLFPHLKKNQIKKLIEDIINCMNNNVEKDDVLIMIYNMIHENENENENEQAK